jgi:hypothetical protein
VKSKPAEPDADFADGTRSNAEDWEWEGKLHPKPRSFTTEQRGSAKTNLPRDPRCEASAQSASCFAFGVASYFTQ